MAAIDIAGETLQADVSGALFWPRERLLIVADLHLEKGSSFARRGQMLPPYDTAATLERLGAVIAKFHPRVVVALGDSFHDPAASARLPATDRAALARLQQGRDWIWIAGNHDPRAPAGLGGDCLPEWRSGGLALRHEPWARPAGGEIAGHLHPVARVIGRAGILRRRCFVSDGARCVMPAFGAYAGGLNLRHEAFAPLFSGDAFTAHVLGKDRVYRIGAARCADGE